MYISSLGNQQLLRTLLSYCSLHGSGGGGLASVRMELVLLLQELQQENNKQQLLSPLPLPTTLPLLSASIASNKTVVVDPVKHLQVFTFLLVSFLWCLSTRKFEFFERKSLQSFSNNNLVSA